MILRQHERDPGAWEKVSLQALTGKPALQSPYIQHGVCTAIVLVPFSVSCPSGAEGNRLRRHDAQLRHEHHYLCVHQTLSTNEAVTKRLSSNDFVSSRAGRAFLAAPHRTKSKQRTPR